MRSIFFFIVFCIIFILAAGCNAQQAEIEELPITLTAIPAPPTLESTAVAQVDVEETPTSTLTPTHTPSPTPTSSPTPIAPSFPGSQPINKDLVGIQVHPFGEDQDVMIAQLQELGVGWVKIQVSWKLFQPAPDRYDEFWFGETDRFIAAANQAGIKVLVGIAKAPEWSRPTTEEDGPPSDYTQFQSFTQLLAERYGSQVHAWELWNESNLRREWNGFPLDGAEFTRLVAAGAAGIRAADPEATLISGAPAPTGINDGASAIDDRVYFEQMLAAGIGDHVDAIGYHPYGASNPAWATLGNTADYAISHNDHPSFFFSHTTEDYLNLMKRYGVEKPLWGTEFGWGSFENLDKTAPAGAEFMDQMNEWQQAEHIIDVYIFAQENDPIGPMFLWNLNFGPLLGADFAETGYSILRPDGSHRTAYYAVKNMPKQ
ncbi:MAG: cellulase family glycosylhydrolase [Chloroflexota bacterium]